MAAGLGTRFGEYTETIPKGFVKCGDISMVERSIRTLIDCGIERIIIGTGYNKEKYEALKLEYPQIECVFSPEKVDFTYIDPEDDDKAERMIDRGRKRVVLGSLPTVTAIFGQMIAHLALQRLLGDEMFDGKEEWNPNLKKR